MIIAFPDNLTTNDSVTTVLDTVKSDMTSVILQETLSSAGIYAHISDSNSKYRHNAENIEYTETSTDASGNTIVTTMSLAEKIKSLKSQISDNNARIVSLNSTLNNNVATINSSIDALNSSVATINSSIGTLNNSVTAISTSVDSLGGNVQLLLENALDAPQQ